MPDEKDKSTNQHFGNPASSSFKLDDYPFYLVDMINSAYGQAMDEVLRRHNMERIQWQLLLIIREQSPISISELAERSGRKLSTVSRTIERMPKENLVSSSPRENDQRVTDVYIEDDGIKRTQILIETAGKQYQHAMKGLSSRDIKGFQEKLRLIIENLARSPGNLPEK